jgi:formate dehydrogenase
MSRLIETEPSGRLLQLGLAGRLAEVLAHADGRVHLLPPDVSAEFERMQSDSGPEGYDLRLIGMREVRSHNSWMHNAPSLMPPTRRLLLRIHPDDARGHGVADGEPVTVESPTGAIVAVALVTDEMTPGTVALPHGWGHHGAWQRANAAGGVCSNVLASSRPEHLERLAAMTVLNGLPVRIHPAPDPVPPP